MSKAKPIERDYVPGARNLYFFFGGIAAGIAMPPFEFYKSANMLNENKVFLRDLQQCWYHKGLPGISHDVYSTAEFLKNEIDTLHPARIFFVGNSMGGFAAIMFSTLVGRGECIAFAPQTFVFPFLRLIHRDNRSSKQKWNMYLQTIFKRKVWELRRLLLRKKSNQKISVFISNNNRLDNIYAAHIGDIPGVKIYSFDEGRHDIVKLLRDQGKLPDIMSGIYE
jgi:hypothetical protein